MTVIRLPNTTRKGKKIPRTQNALSQDLTSKRAKLCKSLNVYYVLGGNQWPGNDCLLPCVLTASGMTGGGEVLGLQPAPSACSPFTVYWC